MARQAQKTGPVVKSARALDQADVTPDYTNNQPGGLIYSPVSSPRAVLKDQGGNIIQLVPTTVSEQSKVPLALIGNGTVVGVFETGANTQEARVRFTTSRIALTGKVGHRNAVAFTAPEDIVSISTTSGNARYVGTNPIGGAAATGHLVSDANGFFDALFIYNTTGKKHLVLTFGNEAYILELTVV